MPRPVLLTILLIAGALLLVTLLPRVSAARWPGNNQGYAPVQPIAYSHRLHAGELQIPCLYCHFGAERSRHAGLPPANVCMNCHQNVITSFAAKREEAMLAEEEGRKPNRLVSEELQKLYDALALDENLERDMTREPVPISWVQVHRLQDFVVFDHRVHVAAGVTCQECHGRVESMERVRQESDLSMGWCVNCHRQVNEEGVAGRRVEASIDCAACHH